MKRLLIATLLLACLALTQGNLMANLVGLDQPAATAMSSCGDPNSPGNE